MLYKLNGTISVAKPLSPSWYLPSQSRNFLNFMEPKIHYHLHHSPTLDSILSHLNPVHTLTSSFSNIHFSIVLPAMSRSLEWTLLLSCGMQFSSPIHVTCTAHLILLAFITLIILDWEYKLWSSSLHDAFHLLVTSCFFCPFILNTLFSNTLHLCSFLGVTDQVSLLFGDAISNCNKIYNTTEYESNWDW
jgi:hypothetical protein